MTAWHCLSGMACSCFPLCIYPSSVVQVVMPHHQICHALLRLLMILPLLNLKTHLPIFFELNSVSCGVPYSRQSNHACVWQSDCCLKQVSVVFVLM